MSAADDITQHMSGRTPTGGVLDYQFTPETLGRVTWDNDDDVEPYRTEFTPGHPVVGSAATYDQVCSQSRLQGSRFIDPFGTVVTPKKVWLLQWFWMLDGCPTPLTRERRQLYIDRAKVLRAWPNDYDGAMPGEPTADYSGIDPNADLSDVP